MINSVRNAVLAIVRSIRATEADIGDGAGLFHDLQMLGDDAAEIFDRLHQQFGTRFDGFEFAKYFPNESESLYYHLASLFGYRSRKPELTFGHLVRVVEAGTWFAPSDATDSDRKKG